MEAAAGGGCGSGPPLLLSEGEQQCYSELFARCAAAGAAGGGPGSGPPETARAVPSAATAAAGPVADLFRASQLPAETLHQITELCGAKRVGYFGPTQFYIALKLIAAAQSGLPVRIESIKCELPLPRFLMSKTDAEIRFGNPTELHGTKVQIPYLITEKNAFKRMDDEDKQQETQSPTMSPLASPPSSPPHYQRVPLSHAYGKLRSNTEQMHPAPYEARQPLVQPEGPSSGAPGTKPPRHQASLIRSFSVEREPQDNNSNYPDEPWRITEEQREYYVNQFRSLQPDPSSFISESNFIICTHNVISISTCIMYLLFFSKKLSVKDMADFPVPTQDVTSDDKQGLKSTADEALPKDVSEDPATSKDSNSLKARPRSRSYSSTSIEEAMKRGEDPPTPPPRPQKTHSRASSLDLNKVFQPSVPATKSGLLPPPPALPPRPCPSQISHLRVNSKRSAQPRPPTQLPNYGDFRLQKQVCKKCRQKIPSLLTSPCSPPVLLCKWDTHIQQRKSWVLNTSVTLFRLRVHAADEVKITFLELLPVQQFIGVQQFVGQPHPVVLHSWASSVRPVLILDAQHLRLVQMSEMISKPRCAELEDFFKRNMGLWHNGGAFRFLTFGFYCFVFNPQDIPYSQPPSKPIRRKFRPENPATENQDTSTAVGGPASAATVKPHAAVQKQSSKQKKAIQTAIRKNKEANAVLARLNSELQQQLKEVHQERIALENQLEQLRPVTVL
uniref:ralBP1-associated Eps domain-containing protein 2 n=1 Tax=Panthera onca TaxID=9690 RepID=UPI002953B0D3|nr:ralBP1-associated Eps domain-containing protein 2 [Panthera onca]